MQAPRSGGTFRGDARPRPYHCYLTVCLLAGLVAACSSPGAAGLPQPGAPQGAVLILLDTVRADHLSCYGYDRPTAPALTELAQRGTLFENVVAAAPWTLPSVGTILSARGIDRATTPNLRQLTASVVESIRRAGYATAAVTEGGFVSRNFGLGLGFDEYVEEEGAVQYAGAGKPNNPNPTGGIKRTFAKARAWIAKHRTDRFFLFIHSYEAHAPYDRRTFTTGLPVPRFGEIFTLDTAELLRNRLISLNDDDLRYVRALYDGGLRADDDELGAFLAFLGDSGLRDRIVVAVTSDHGEELGDHYPAHSGDHGHSLHDELVMVPLVLHNPLEEYPVRRVQSQVRTIDVLPTIADILGVHIDFPIDGASLVPVLRGVEREGRIAYGGQNGRGPRQVFLRHLGYKYIAVIAPQERDREPVLPPPPPVQLYDLTRDPHERTNLADSQPQVVREMERVLTLLRAPDADRQASAPPAPMDAALRERLRSLGYLRNN